LTAACPESASRSSTTTTPFASACPDPPGVQQALYAIPGSLLGLAASYVHGSRQDDALE
jgi:hypothetical protein